MNWKDPNKELPKDGKQVAVLIYHWKKCWPHSAEIYFGEVESYIDDEGNRHARVSNCDFIGGGSASWSFDPYSDYPIEAWCYASEFVKPDFIEHNPHWGECGKGFGMTGSDKE